MSKSLESEGPQTLPLCILPYRMLGDVAGCDDHGVDDDGNVLENERTRIVLRQSFVFYLPVGSRSFFTHFATSEKTKGHA